MEEKVKYFRIEGKFLQAVADFIISRPYKEVANLVPGFNEITEIIEEAPVPLDALTSLSLVPDTSLQDEGSAQC
jgi:hypothetical protein